MTHICSYVSLLQQHELNKSLSHINATPRVIANLCFLYHSHIFPFSRRKCGVWVMGKDYGAKNEDLFSVLPSKGGEKAQAAHLLSLIY